MASIAELLIQSVAQQARTSNAPDIAGNFAKGAQLAMQREQLELQKQKNAEDLDQVENVRINRLTQAISNGKNVDPKGRKDYYGKFIPKLRDALGLTEKFPDEALKFATMTDQNLARFDALESRVRNGQLTKEGAVAIINDPSKFVQVLPLAPGETFEAPELTPEISAALGKAETTSVMAKAQAARQQSQQDFQASQTAGEAMRTADKDFAKDYNKYIQGGREDALKNLEDYQNAIKMLEGPEEISSVKSTAIPYIGTKDELQAGLNPKMLEVRRSIRAAVMGTLKQTLGAQFTEAEGERIFNLAYNPALTDAANIKNAKLQLKYLQRTLRHKDATAAYFRKNKTLDGFDPNPNPNKEFTPAGGALKSYPGIDSIEKYDKLSPGAKQRLQEIEGKNDVQIRKLLGGS